MDANGQIYSPVALPPGMAPTLHRYQLDRKLGGPQRRFIRYCGVCSCCYATTARRNVHCSVTAGKQVNNTRAIARQKLRNKRVQQLLCDRRINKRPFIDNGSINTPTIEELLKAVFSVGSASRLYNEDPMPAEGIDKISARATGQEGAERGNLKNFNC
jgi:hypothetical protein